MNRRSSTTCKVYGLSYGNGLFVRFDGNRATALRESHRNELEHVRRRLQALTVYVFNRGHFGQRRRQILLGDELPLKQQLTQLNHLSLLFLRFLEGFLEIRGESWPRSQRTSPNRFRFIAPLFYGAPKRTGKAGTAEGGTAFLITAKVRAERTMTGTMSQRVLRRAGRRKTQSCPARLGLSAFPRLL